MLKYLHEYKITGIQKHQKSNLMQVTLNSTFFPFSKQKSCTAYLLQIEFLKWIVIAFCNNYILHFGNPFRKSINRHILFIFWLTSLRIYGQQEIFNFTHLNENNGLSSNIVNCIMKDSKGYLWIGTYGGFNLYDGENFYPHKKRKGENTLVNEVIHDMCEDMEGKIWCASHNGVFRYDAQDDVYTNYLIKSLRKFPYFFNILCDKRGEIWAAGVYSIFKYNKSKDQFEEYIKLVNPHDTTAYSFITKNGFVEDIAGKGFWVTTSLGLCFIDAFSGKIKNAGTEKKNPLYRTRNTAALHKSAKGNFWFFDNDTKTIVQFDPVKEKEILNIQIGKEWPKVSGATLFEDKNKRIWFSSWTNDILVSDLSKESNIQRLYHRPEDLNSIAGNFFWTAYQDDNSTIWLGTVAGISRCNPEKKLYKEFRIFEQVKEMRDKAIQVATVDPTDQSFWLATKTGHILHYNPNIPKNYTWLDLKSAKKNNEGDLPGLCSKLLLSEHHIIIFTSSGVWQISKGQNKIIPFDSLPENHKNFNCRELAYDGDSVVYFNNGKEILYWNKKNSKTQIYSFRNSNDAENIYGLCVSKNHKVWAITNDSQLVEIKNGFLVHRNLYRNIYKENGIITSIVPDKFNSSLWVVKAGVGIYRINELNNKIELWDETDGLFNNRVHFIQQDNAGKIWTMLYDKVSVLTPKSSDFSNFKVPYGQSELDYINYLCTNTQGHIIGTVFNEIVEFYPEKLMSVPMLQKPHISQLKVLGKVILMPEQNLELNPFENTVRISFGSLITKEIFPYDLWYTLEGAENAWTEAGGHMEAMYNNLKPGSYTFKVRAQGKDNSWISDEALLHFTIKTPYYKSTWFTILLVLFATSIIYLLYLYRVREIKKRENLKSEFEKQIMESRMEALKAQMNPHFIFNCLNSINRYIIKNDVKSSSLYLTKFAKLIRLILDNSKFRYISLASELEALKLYIEMEAFRFEKKFNYEVLIEESLDIENIKIPPLIIQPYVENAIWHGLLHKDDQGTLTIECRDQTQYVLISVTDNGIGRNKSQELKSEGSATRKSMGLKLTEDRIQYFNEDQKYISKPEIIDLFNEDGSPAGTKVTIKIYKHEQD